MAATPYAVYTHSTTSLALSSLLLLYLLFHEYHWLAHNWKPPSLVKGERLQLYGVRVFCNFTP